MPLSWNEIKTRAVAFTIEWKDEVREGAEAKSFWDDFFHVFGISRRRVATFEQQGYNYGRNVWGWEEEKEKGIMK